MADDILILNSSHIGFMKQGDIMNLTFSDRAMKFQAGIFAVLDEKKHQLLKDGRTVYNLSVGTPDFPTPPHVLEAVSEAARDPESFKYSMTDRPFLKKAVQDFYEKRFSVSLEEDEIMTISGSQEGMAHIALALCNPGDTVLVPNPGYPIFSIGPQLCGAIAETYDLLPENDYLPDFNAIPDEVADRASYILVSYPLNPVCAVADDAFYLALIDWAKKHHVIVIHDNAYSDIIYDGREGKSFLSYPGAKDIGVEFYSLSKSYNMTGARTSLVLGNKDIVKVFRDLRSQFDYGLFLPLQYGIAAALSGPQEGVKKQCEDYELRMKTLCAGLREIGWNVPDSKGTMFVWAKLPEGKHDSTQFTMELMEKAGVIVTPGASFGSLGEGYVRMALVLPPEKMKEVVEAIRVSGIL